MIIGAPYHTSAVNPTVQAVLQLALKHIKMRINGKCQLNVYLVEQKLQTCRPKISLSLLHELFMSLRGNMIFRMPRFKMLADTIRL